MVRCKFYCTEKTKRQHWDRERGFLWSYKFQPVTGGSPENEQFWAATPGGTLQIDSVVKDLFEVGKDYYLDLTEA